MTFPLPALEQFSPPLGSDWSRTYLLQNEDASPIDGDGVEVYFEVWNEPRTIQYGAATLTWVARDPAELLVTVGSAVLAAIGAGNTGYCDLLIINNGKRQYLVEVELSPVTP
jgi:hypothetical protein